MLFPPLRAPGNDREPRGLDARVPARPEIESQARHGALSARHSQLMAVKVNVPVPARMWLGSHQAAEEA